VTDSLINDCINHFVPFFFFCSLKVDSLAINVIKSVHVNVEVHKISVAIENLISLIFMAIE
jgi:hypothetical protein